MRLSEPAPPRPELERLIKEAVAKYKAMTLEEKEALHKAQGESYVRAELGWPKDCPYR